MQLSKYFTLADLTITGSSASNKPDPTSLENLKKLAGKLDILYDKVGPFKVISGYRSPAVQAAIKSGASGSASAAQVSTTSYHMKGIAADIQPKNQTPEQFMAKIAQMSDVKNLLGEIAIKKNALHVSLATPEKQGVFMWVDGAGKYIRFKSNELAAIISRNKIAVGAGLGTIVLAGLAIYFFMRGRK